LACSRRPFLVTGTSKTMGWAFYGQVAVIGSMNTEKDLHWPTSQD